MTANHIFGLKSKKLQRLIAGLIVQILAHTRLPIHISMAFSIVSRQQGNTTQFKKKHAVALRPFFNLHVKSSSIEFLLYCSQKTTFSTIDSWKSPVLNAFLSAHASERVNSLVHIAVVLPFPFICCPYSISNAASHRRDLKKCGKGTNH